MKELRSSYEIEEQEGYADLTKNNIALKQCSFGPPVPIHAWFDPANKIFENSPNMFR